MHKGIFLIGKDFGDLNGLMLLEVTRDVFCVGTAARSEDGQIDGFAHHAKLLEGIFKYFYFLIGIHTGNIKTDVFVPIDSIDVLFCCLAYSFLLLR